MSDRWRLERSTDAPDAAREPMARSAFARARMNCGVCPGSMAMSASAKAMIGADAAATPARTAPPLPWFSESRSIRTWGNAENRAPARAVVSSTLPSSTTTNSVVSGTTAPAAMAVRRRATPSSSRDPSL